MCRGKSKTKPTIFLGFSFKRGNPQPWNLTPIDHIMVNAYDILNRDVPVEKIHDMLSFDGEIFCDSGGWQLLQGSVDIDIAKIVETQGILDADYSAVLDNGNDSKTHLEYLAYYLKNADFDFVPIIPYDMSTRDIEKVRQIVQNPSMIAIGKLVPILRPPIDHKALCTAMRSIVRIRQAFPRTRLHIFGLGGLYTILIFLLLADSTDSSSWIHDARYGKIRMFGGKGTFSTHPRDGLKHLDPHTYFCSCPVCMKHDVADLDARGIAGLRLRASHNAWVITREAELIWKYKSEGGYYRYVQERLKQSPHHKNLFDYVTKQLDRGVVSAC